MERKDISQKNAPAQERMNSMEKTIQGRRSHLRGNDRGRTVGKRQPSGIDNCNSHPGEKPVAKEEPPYQVGTTQYDREEKIMIKVRIQRTDGKECTTTALVDSGASENFIDKAYAEASEIPMQQKTTPRRVLTVDGREVTGGPVTHNTEIHLTINHHEEDIWLHCITIGNAPIILGLPWLKLHDPVIGWKNHTVKFHSDHCADRCLPSSPRANTVPEEKATEQYYKKTPAEEENWEIGETDAWEVCQTVIDKIKETSRTNKKPIPLEYHEFLEVFTEMEPVAPPPHRTQDHHIPLEEGKTPLYEPLHPLNEDKMKALRKYLEINEKWGWIRASTSPAGAPIHFVTKKDGRLYLCVDYRQLNDITIKDRTPLPLIGESLDQLSSATIYTKLDIRDAYYNLRIAKGDEWKTVFRTRYGLYEFCVMPSDSPTPLPPFSDG